MMPMLSHMSTSLAIARLISVTREDARASLIKKKKRDKQIHQMLRDLMTSYKGNIKAIWLQQFIIQIISIDIVSMTFILNYERMAYDI